VDDVALQLLGSSGAIGAIARADNGLEWWRLWRIDASPTWRSAASPR
jgi:hypothetical protein